MTIQITPLGAGQDVGRSCILVTINNKNIIFDCGMVILNFMIVDLDDGSLIVKMFSTWVTMTNGAFPTFHSSLAAET